MIKLSNSINEALKAGYNADEINAFLQNNDKYKDEYASVLASTSNDAKLTFELLRSGKRLGALNNSLPNDKTQEQDINDFNKALSWLNPTQAKNYNESDFYKAKAQNNDLARIASNDEKLKRAEFEKQYQNKSRLSKISDELIGEDMSDFLRSEFGGERFFNANEKEGFKNQLLKEIREHIQKGGKFEDLSKAQKRLLNERFKQKQDSNLLNAVDIIANDDEKLAKKGFELEQKRAYLANKEFKDLDEKDKEFIKGERGFFNALFENEKEELKEFKQAYKSEGILSTEVQKSINTLKQFDESHLLKNVFFADDEESKKLKEKYLSAAYDIAELNGFDDVGLDKEGELYFFKGDEAFKVNTGFFDNFLHILNDTKGEIGASIAGSIAGAKKGKTPRAKIANAIIGGAIGASLGATSDALLADRYLNRNSNFQSNLDYAIQAGLLSVAGDSLIAGIAKAGKGGISKIGNLVDKLSDQAPIISMAKNLKSNNIKAAEEILNYSDQEKEALKQAFKKMGGDIKESQTNDLSQIKEALKAKFGENSLAFKSLDFADDFLNNNSLKAKQHMIFSLIRSDESGKNLAFLMESVKRSPRANANLVNILNLSTRNLKKELDKLEIKKADIKIIFDEFEKGTKQSYDEAINKTLMALYDERYKAVIDKKPFEALLENLQDQKLLLNENDKAISDNLIQALFDEKGLSFKELVNLDKNLNASFKAVQNPNLKDFLQNELKGEIKKAIRTGIDNIFSQNKTAYAKAKKLFENTMSDYANMKELLKQIDKLKLRDKAQSEEADLNKLFKFLQGKGENELSNLDFITRHLSDENRAIVELNVLNSLFEKSLLGKQRQGIEVFNSNYFLKNLQSLSQKSEKLFKSKEAQAYIDVIKGFNELFNQDAQIALSLSPALTRQGAEQGLTSDLMAKAKYQVASGIWNNVILRNLNTHSILGKLYELFKGKGTIGGLALTHHLKKALERSVDVDEFKELFNQSVKKSNFSNKTQGFIKEFNEILDEAQAEKKSLIAKQEQEAIAQKQKEQEALAKLQAEKEAAAREKEKIAQIEQLRKDYANGDLKTYETLQKYDVNDLNLLSKPEYESFVDDVLSDDVEKLKQAPNIVHIANLNEDLKELLSLENGKIFLRKNDLHHFRAQRKVEYNQNLDDDTLKNMPEILSEAKEAYKDSLHNNFFIIKELNENEIATFHINKDELGNYIITAKRANKDILNQKEFTRLGSGIEPHIYPHKNEDQLPATASPNLDENIIPQKEPNLPKNEPLKKQSEESLQESKLAKKDEASQVGDKPSLAEKESFFDFKQSAEFKEFEKKKQEFKQQIEKTSDEKQKLKIRDELYKVRQSFYKLMEDKYKIDPYTFIFYEHVISKKGDFIKDLKKFDLDENSKPDASAMQELKWALDKYFQIPTNANYNNVKVLESQLLLNEYPLEIRLFNYVFDSNLVQLRQGIDLHKADEIREYYELLLNIHPIKDFGTNYAEFYRDGKGAIEKLLKEKQGQVSGAFYRQDLGDITLPYGNDELGLKKIYEKHLSDFASFGEGEKGLINGLSEIVENGKLVNKNGVNTLWLKKDDEYYLAGLSKGFKGQGNESWIITSYKKTKGEIPSEIKGDTANLSAYSDEFNPLLTSKDEPLNSKDIIPQKSEISQEPLTQRLSDSPKFSKELTKNFKLISKNYKEAQKALEKDDYEAYNDYFAEVLESLDELLKNKDFQDSLIHFRKAYFNPLQTEAEVFGAGLSYKAKVFGKGKNKEMRISGGGISQEKLNKLSKLSQLEQERLARNLFVDIGLTEDSYNMPILKQWLDDLMQEISKDRYLQYLRYDEKLRPYKENRILETDKITEAKKKLYLKRTEFGENYAEFYHKGGEAISHLLKTKSGQVQGAFYRQDLGDITLPYGNDELGLKKIYEKHLSDFASFGEGEKGLINGLSEIVEKGTLKSENKVHTIIYKKDDETYRVGISQGWHGQGNDKWIITSYKVDKSPRSDALPSSEIAKDDGTNLRPNDKDIIPQNPQNLQELPKGEVNEAPKQQLNSDMLALKNSLKEAAQQAHKAKNISEKELVELVDKEAKEIKSSPDYARRSKEQNDYFFEILKPIALKEFEKTHFNQISEDLAKKLFADFKRQDKQILADKLRAFKDENALKVHILQTWKEKYVKKPFENSRIFLLNVVDNLRDDKEALKKIGFENEDLSRVWDNTDPSFKAKFSKLQMSFKKGEFLGLDEIVIPRIIQDARTSIQDFLEITPIKDFGTNYAEFYRDGKGAIEKLLNEKQGQVSGAFYRKDLEELSGTGEIAVVWGEVSDAIKHEGFGLAHILDKHGKEFNDIAQEISDIVEKGQVIKDDKGRLRIESEKFIIGIKDNYKGVKTDNWIVTAYKKKEGGGSLYTSPHNNTNEILSETSLQDTIIPKIEEKFKFNAQKAKDLYDWHKDSDPLTKDEQGLPRVFYHGTKKDSYKYKEISGQEVRFFEEFKRGDTGFNVGFWFAKDKELAENYANSENSKNSKIYKVFLKIKKPFIMERALNKAKIEEIQKIFGIDDEKSVKKAFEIVEHFKEAKKEMEKQGVEFLDFWRERLIVRDKETGEVMDAWRLIGTRKEIKERLKEEYEFYKDKSSKIFKEFENEPEIKFVKRKLEDKNFTGFTKLYKMLYKTGELYWKDYFKDETELFMLNLLDSNFKEKHKFDFYLHTRHEQISKFMKDAGYDGILYNENEFVVFDSNQIKAVDNKGSYTDNNGKITKTKPKNAEASHSYFNETSPNIYHSNTHLGAGLVGGTLNGVSEDENGNLSFDPSDFVKGFLGGAVGSKAVKTALNKSPNLKAKAEKFAKNAFENVKQTLQNSNLDKNARTALENIFSKELIKALDSRAFVRGEKGLKAFEKANKESLAKLDIMAIKKLNKGERMQIPIKQGDFKTLQTELDKKLIVLKGKEFVNNETGIKAHIATRGIGEIISNVKRSVENGFTFKEHFATAENIEAIFEKAHFIGKSKDIKHNDPNVSIYRFSCPILLELKQANAILTLKEWKENGKRIYALKLEQLEKAKDES